MGKNRNQGIHPEDAEDEILNEKQIARFNDLAPSNLYFFNTSHGQYYLGTKSNNCMSGTGICVTPSLEDHNLG